MWLWLVACTGTTELPTDTDTLGLLLHGVEAYSRYQLEHPDYLRLTLREGGAWSSSRAMTLPEQLDAWNTGYALAVQTFRAGVDDGTFVDEPPELLARMMIALQQVVLGEWVEQGMTEPHDAVLRRVRHAMIRTFATDRARARWQD